MSAETEANGSVVCLSLTHYLEPNSGASIKVLMENEHEVIVVGTATAPHGDIQVDDTFFLSVDTVAFELYCVCCVCIGVQYVTKNPSWPDYTSSHLLQYFFLLLPIAH
jgi:hypothetical protein